MIEVRPLDVRGRHFIERALKSGEVHARARAYLQGALTGAGHLDRLLDVISPAPVQPTPCGVSRVVERVLEGDEIFCRG